MQLSQLIDKPIPKDCEITGLSLDSRETKPGDVFFAVPGFSFDGREFIETAILKGAHAIVVENDIRGHYSVPVIKVRSVRKAISYAASQFYTLKPQTRVMVTGTNGKSTTVSFVQQLWCYLGKKAASIGTLGVKSAVGLPPLSHEYKLTTPDAITLHALLSELESHGYTHIAMEATSIGLDQYRLHHIPIEAAAFTNFTQDHLDYHSSMGQYFHAKTKLFTELLPQGKPAILNHDIAQYEELCKVSGDHPLLSFGTKPNADLVMTRREPHENGQSLTLTYQGKSIDVEFPLWGDFQGANLLAATLLCLSTGFAFDEICAAIPKLKNVPGRLQRVNASRIFVDYAHTPDALETALHALRPHAKGRIGVVFGCGGDRDKSKRPLMGKIASEKADFVVVTDDNPRSENPATIRQEILAACPGALEIGDRRKAIESGMTELKSEDILVVAGKGHETGQIIGDQTLPFNDVDVIEEILGIRHE